MCSYVSLAVAPPLVTLHTPTHSTHLLTIQTHNSPPTREPSSTRLARALALWLLLFAVSTPAEVVVGAGANQVAAAVDEVHVVALWTPQATPLLREWTRLMITAVDADTSDREYKIHTHRFHYG